MMQLEALTVNVDPRRSTFQPAAVLPSARPGCCWSRASISSGVISGYGTARAASMTSRARFVAASRARFAVTREFAPSIIASVPRMPTTRMSAAAMTSTIVKPSWSRRTTRATGMEV